MTAYLTVAELALSVDTTLLASLAADGASTGTVNQSNTILTTAIDRASAMIDMAATRNSLYSTTELADLYTAGDWGIRSVCAGLTLGMLYARRGKETPNAIAEAVDMANRTLDDLRDGKKVFAVASARAAGLPEIGIISASTRVQLQLAGNMPFFPPMNTQVAG